MKAPVRQGTLSRMSPKRRVRRGAAAVELAIVAPLFLLLLAGIIEFGQAFRIEHTISNASRRGARGAVLDGATSADVTQNVAAQCSRALGVDEADVTVEISVNGDSNVDVADAEKEDEISVTVSIPFSRAGVGFFAHMFSNSVLSSTCTFEHE